MRRAYVVRLEDLGKPLVGVLHANGWITVGTLIDDDADPRADAGQRPDIEQNASLGEPAECADLQPTRWATATENECALHAFCAFQRLTLAFTRSGFRLYQDRLAIAVAWRRLQ